MKLDPTTMCESMARTQRVAERWHVLGYAKDTATLARYALFAG